MREISENQLVCALMALVKAGVPSDVQELLLHGNPDRGVKPNALERALEAAAHDLQN